MSAFLAVGSPAVRQSVFGDWLVDDGSLVPQRLADRHAAFAEAAVRAMSPTDAAPPVAGGWAPGSPVASPRVSGSGAPKTVFRREGEVGVSGAVGAGTPTRAASG